MKNNWTKEMLDEFIEMEGGCTMNLVLEFPFSSKDRKAIKDAFNDEKNYTDSDVCDLIAELAYKAVA